MNDDSRRMILPSFPPEYRASGVLLHVAALPSPYGIGDVGPAAAGARAPEAIKASNFAREPIVAKLTRAPGNGAPIRGLKVVTQRLSGSSATLDV